MCVMSQPRKFQRVFRQSTEIGGGDHAVMLTGGENHRGACGGVNIPGIRVRDHGRPVVGGQSPLSVPLHDAGTREVGTRIGDTFQTGDKDESLARFFLRFEPAERHVDQLADPGVLLLGQSTLTPVVTTAFGDTPNQPDAIRMPTSPPMECPARYRSPAPPTSSAMSAAWLAMP